MLCSKQQLMSVVFPLDALRQFSAPAAEMQQHGGAIISPLKNYTPLHPYLLRISNLSVPI
jgi:hypothetical protein